MHIGYQAALRPSMQNSSDPHSTIKSLQVKSDDIVILVMPARLAISLSSPWMHPLLSCYSAQSLLRTASVRRHFGYQ